MVVADRLSRMPASGMPYRRLGACLAGLLLAGCSGTSLPQRGFATRFYQRSVEPTFDPPAAFGGSAPITPDGKSVSPGSCEAVAQKRAADIAAQNFSTDMQQKVFDATLRDCRAGRSRYGGPAG